MSTALITIVAVASLASAPDLAVLEGSPDQTPEVGVPFGCGRVYPVSQSHNTGSHQQNDAYAWDFRMPTGTPIVAAGDGVVRLARGDSKVGGCDPAYARHANYVVITHPSGLETQYLHFSAVVVKPGDRVQQGDLIGYSGATGWACGAHLHFKVAKPRGSGWNNPSVQARIAGYGDPDVNTLVASPLCPIDRATIAEAATRAVEPSVRSTVPAVDRSEASGGAQPAKAVRGPARSEVRPAKLGEGGGSDGGQSRPEVVAPAAKDAAPHTCQGR